MTARPQRHQLGELVVGQLGDPALAGADHRIRQLAFRLQQGCDAVLQRALGDQPVHLDGTVLPDPVGAVGRLVLHRRVPPAVVVQHMGGAGEGQAGAARLQRQQEHRRLTGLELLDHLLAAAHRDPAVQEQRPDTAAVQVLLQQRRHLRVLGEHQHRLAAGQDDVGQLVEGGQLAGPARPAARAASGTAPGGCRSA